MSTSSLPRRTLGSTGIQVSVVGLGCAHLGASTDQSTATATVRAALNRGVNFLDTSPAYGGGLSESRLGEALAGIPRSHFVLQTKCGDEGPQNAGHPAFTRQAVLASVQHSLDVLNQSYLDTLLLHDCYMDELKTFLSDDGGMRAIYELKSAGKIKHFGLGCREHQAHVDLLKAVGPEHFQVSVAVDDHNLMRRFLDEGGLRAALREGNVGLINGAPLYRGLLTDTATIYGSAMGDAHPKLVECSKRMREWAKGRGEKLLDLAVAFPLQDEGIATSIYGCRSAEEIEQVVSAAERFEEKVPVLKAFEEEMAGELEKLSAEDHFYWFKDQTAASVEWPEMRVYPRELWKDAIYKAPEE